MDRDGNLECERGHSFAVVAGVPRFDDDEYVSSFGYQWRTFARTEIQWERGRESERDLREKLGLGPADVDGKIVLEIGCGTGRHSRLLTEWGARVVAVDKSEAVDSAVENLRGRSAQVVRADANRLPLAPDMADLVISIGVLHHTPDTRAAFEALLPCVKPGGRIAIWVYSNPHVVYPGGELLRRWTSRMEPARLLRLCRMSAALHPLYRVPGLQAALQQVLPLSTHPDREMRILNTFDWYSPAYQWKHTYPEVFSWFVDAGLVDVRPLDFPVSMTGTKPPTHG